MYIDFTKLNHLVNDTIINFFLRFVQHEILDRQQQFKIFSTYHTAKIVPYENILQVSSQAELAEEFGRNFQTILKWTKDDIFNCPYILFPLHLKEHWSLMVVYDAVSICRAMIEGTPQQGGFIYLDSLQILDEKILFLLKMYQIHNKSRFLLQIYCRQFGIQLSHA
jgi:sentrin-specific protease 7